MFVCCVHVCGCVCVDGCYLIKGIFSIKLEMYIYANSAGIYFQSTTYLSHTYTHTQTHTVHPNTEKTWVD